MDSHAIIMRKIRQFLKDVNKKYSLEKAVLFGSRARGDWLKSSDVDIILVSRKFENIQFLERSRKVYKLWKSDVLLQPICYTPEEFERKKKELGIVRQAVKEGKELALVS